MSRTKTFLVLGIVAVAAGLAWFQGKPGKPQLESTSPPERRMVCIGRIEAVSGEVDVSAQMPGTIESLFVKEGDVVEAGAILAVIEARREKALVDFAEAKLALMLAGSGQEEIEAAKLQSESMAAELAYAKAEMERAKTLRLGQIVSEDYWELKLQRVEALARQFESLQKKYEALKRGALPEELAVARAELELAQVNYDLRNIRAPFSGTVSGIYRHAGDGVLLNFPTPVLQFVNTQDLQLRIEINEKDIYQIHLDDTGIFEVLGTSHLTGKFAVKTISPIFSSKRLFDPDTSVRADTRTVQVLCRITNTYLNLYAGQRVKIIFDLRPE